MTVLGAKDVIRDNGKRRIYVEANSVGRDMGSYVDEGQPRLASDVRLAPNTGLEWGGQFQNLQAATARLTFIVPVCLVLIAAALYLAIGNAMRTATVLTAVPLAQTGGVFALALRGKPYSISASVGFIAVSGVSVLNGLVLISAINKHLADGFDAR